MTTWTFIHLYSITISKTTYYNSFDPDFFLSLNYISSNADFHDERQFSSDHSVLVHLHLIIFLKKHFNSFIVTCKETNI